MKNIKFFSMTLLILFIFVRCDKGIQSSLNNQSFTLIDVQYSPEYQFPKGYYYKLELSDRYERIYPPEFLDTLYSKGIFIEFAWYRGPLYGCSPPGSNIVTRTLYPTYFVVMLTNEQNEIINYNFVKIDIPTSIPCGYGTKIYAKIND